MLDFRICMGGPVVMVLGSKAFEGVGGKGGVEDRAPFGSLHFIGLKPITKFLLIAVIHFRLISGEYPQIICG